MTPSSPDHALAQALWPAGTRPAQAARAVLLVLLGSLFITIGAKVQVPMWPVPMTMQTFAVLVVGATLGWRLGAAAVLAYLLQGLAGLPVFSGPLAGPAYFAGPTAGYLVGFLFSAMLAGWLVERGWGRSVPRLTAALALASIVPFLPGAGWLAILLGGEMAIAAGVTPFLLGAILKLALAVAMIVGGQRLLRD